MKLSRLLIFAVVAVIGLIGLSELIGWVMHYAPEPIGSRADLFAEGAKATILLTLGSGLMGLVIGVLAGLGKLSASWFLRGPSELFVWLFRGTPLLVQILFIYYAVPSLIPSWKITEFVAAILGLGLNVGAYNAEVIRAGILAIPRGQSEAAWSLGLSTWQSLRYVVLPQAFQVVVPPLINNLVALLKDSSLASSIGLLELTLVGNRISSETFMPVPVLTTAAALYLVFTTAIAGAGYWYERIAKAEGVR